MRNPSEPVLLNPGWKSILRTILEERVNANERLKNWITTVLQPWIEKNLEDQCIKLYVKNIQMNIEQAFEGDLMVDIEAVLLPSAIQRSLPVPDANIVTINVTHTNQEVMMPYGGWRLPTMRVHMETQFNITWRPPSRDAVYRLQETMYTGGPVWMYAGLQEIRDLLDWAVQAKIPRTATFLPVATAKELSHKWHEQQAKKAQKLKERSVPKGTRKHIGRLKTLEGYDIPAGDTYDVFWLQDKAALEYETVLQHHCVWSYWPRVERRESLILHMRNIDPEKANDRWTIELGALLWEYRGHSPDAMMIQVRQFRGITNQNAHLDLSTGFGNMFLTWEEDKKPKGLFEQLVPLEIGAIKEHLKSPIDIPT